MSNLPRCRQWPVVCVHNPAQSQPLTTTIPLASPQSACSPVFLRPSGLSLKPSPTDHTHTPPCLVCLPPSHVVTGPADCRRHDGHHGKRRHQHSSVGFHSDGGLWRGRNPGSIPGVPVAVGLAQRFRDTRAFPATRTKFSVNTAADFRLMNMDRGVGGAESIQLSIELNKTVIK